MVPTLRARRLVATDIGIIFLQNTNQMVIWFGSDTEEEQEIPLMI